jgi:hypothetical protein
MEGLRAQGWISRTCRLLSSPTAERIAAQAQIPEFRRSIGRTAPSELLLLTYESM